MLGAAWMVTAWSVAACGRGEPSSSPLTSPLSTAIVERVVDGDTIDVAIDGRHERVRLLGVDAPESVSPSVPEQCFGAEASAALSDALPIGTQLDISRDIEARDRYDRLLLYLHRSEDGLFVNRWLLEAGLADSVSYEPNTAHTAEFDRVRHRAEADRIGLWGSCDGPDQPLD